MSEPSELHETIAAKGQLEKAIARMVVEDTTAAMAKSLNGFLDRLEAEEAARTARYESIVKGAVSEAVQPLTATFSAFGETVNDLQLDVADLKTAVAAHDREIASFRESRDQSIAEREQLRADLEESKADRQLLHQEGDEARERFDHQETLIRRLLDHLGLSDAAE